MRTIWSTAMWGVATASILLLVGCGSDSPTEPFSCTPGTPVVVSYHDIGTFQADTVSEFGTLITGSNTINVLQLNGLGILGGSSDNSVDGTEWIRFDFDDSPVSQVSYFVPAAGNGNGDGTVGDAMIEAFDRTGASLGTVPVTSTGTKSVSAMFNDEPLSAFVVTAAVDLFRIGTATYSRCE